MRTGIVVGVALFSVAIWVFNVARLTRVAMFSIERVEINGADSAIIPALVTTTYADLSGTYAGILAKSSSFIFPKKNLASALEAVSPRIASVTLTRKGLQTLVVNVNEKVPAAVVCATLPDFSADQNIDPGSPCYVADASGLIFKQVSDQSLPPVNRYFIPDLPTSASSTDLLDGTYATSTSKFLDLQDLMNGARHAGLKPEGILVKEGGEYELYAHNPDGEATATTTDDTVVVYFNDSQPLSVELSNLMAFWAKKNEDARVSGRAIRFESIDVRYGDNVFYRLMP